VHADRSSLVGGHERLLDPKRLGDLDLGEAAPLAKPLQAADDLFSSTGAM